VIVTKHCHVYRVWLCLLNISLHVLHAMFVFKTTCKIKLFVEFCAYICPYSALACTVIAQWDSEFSFSMYVGVCFCVYIKVLETLKLLGLEITHWVHEMSRGFVVVGRSGSRRLDHRHHHQPLRVQQRHCRRCPLDAARRPQHPSVVWPNLRRVFCSDKIWVLL